MECQNEMIRSSCNCNLLNIIRNLMKLIVNDAAHALFSEQTKQIQVTPGMPGVVLLCSN